MNLRNPASIITVTDLTKTYPAGEAVREVSFSVDRGELFVFLGPNGAGKSSTIKMLTGLLQPSSGWATVAGHDVAQNPMAVKRSIGYMAEYPYLYDKLSGFEFLHFLGDVYGVPRKLRDERIADLLRILEMTGAARRLIETYSQGMRQKIALAGVLVHRPPVLFLDEPTNGLDPRSSRIVKDLLRGICSQGATVFMTTHILEIAEQMCDRVAILNHGRLVAIGTLDELRAQVDRPGGTLEDIFLGLTGAAAPFDLGLYGAPVASEQARLPPSTRNGLADHAAFSSTGNPP